MKKQVNAFLLPDELGWEANDELKAYFYKWMGRYRRHLDVPPDVMVAELMDNWYAMIKRYQQKAP